MSEYGKIPPQAIEAEIVILGAMLLEKDAVKMCIDRFGNNSVFYKDEHNKIYQAIKTLFENRTHIDMITVTQKMRDDGTLEEIGGPYFLSCLTDKVASAAHLESHIEIVLQKSVLRNLIQLTQKVSAKAFEDNPAIELIDNTSLELGRIKALASTMYNTGISDELNGILDDIMAIKAGHKKFSGIPTMINQLDKMIYGLNKTDLIVIGGRASMGKSALACTFVYNLLLQGYGVGMFSLEMSKDQLLKRLIILDSEIDNDILKRPDKMTDDEYNRIEKSAGVISKKNLRIDDRAGLHINDIYSTAVDMKEKYGVSVIVVDYLQLARGEKTGNRSEEVASISRKLKQMAKDLDIPVIALSQIGRAAEQQANKKPTMANLSESGAIENDADLVLLAYRPEYYGMNTYTDFSGQDINTNELAVLIVAKHRNGATGEVYCKFKHSLMKFKNFDNTPNNISAVDNYYERDIPINTDFENEERPF